MIMCAGDYQIDDGDQKGAKQHELIKRDKSHLHHLPSTGRQKEILYFPLQGSNRHRDSVLRARPFWGLAEGKYTIRGRKSQSK
jgi:hypothetical protein